MDFLKLFQFDEPKIMAIINMTPDSYYSTSRHQADAALLKSVEKSIEEGADCIDIGAVSTRPGSEFVTEEEELKRLIPALDLITKHFPNIPISVDTFRCKIAQHAHEHGASLINDVSYGSDPELIKYCSAQKLPYILMHLRGTPNNMMQNTNYENVVVEVFAELQKKSEALKKQGLTRIILDPGFGFSKTVEQNYELLKQLDYFKHLNFPIMVGLSRKSMIYKILNTTPENTLNGTSVLHTIALLKGAKILRVHDVKEAVECRTLVRAMESNQCYNMS